MNFRKGAFAGSFFYASLKKKGGPLADKKLFLKFLLPSLVGVLLFLCPINYNGNETILLAVITSIVRSPFEAYMLEIIVSIVILSALGSGYFILLKPEWKETRPSLYIMCQTTPLWFIFRLVGAIFAILVYFKIGPEFIWSDATGYLVFTDIGATIFFIITVACFLMPFLTEFGFMEFVGTLVSRPFGLLFTLPGRSAIDAMASFLTASNVGLLITISQYEKGQYSTREAACIAVNFSVVSISFSLLIAQVAGIDHLFVKWYLSVVVACVFCAFITVRLPPLSRLADSYYFPVGKQVADELDQSGGAISRAARNAMARARTAPEPKQFILNGWHGAVGVVFGVLGPSMAVGTTTIILLTHTPVFNILSYPLYYLFDIFNFPEANVAAPGMIIGFLDQFMPAVIASKAQSEMVKFILAGMAVTQLIYMSEVGLIILRSSLPLKFKHLAAIFLMRTLISFPILFMAAIILI